MNNEELDKQIAKTKSILTLIGNINNKDLDEVKRVTDCKKYYYEKCKELLDKYPDKIKLGKYVEACIYYLDTELSIDLSLNSELASKLYSEYCSSSSEIHQYFIKAFNLLTKPFHYNNLVTEVHIEEFDLESNDWDYLAESHKKDIDNRLKNLEKSFENIIILSKNKKFTDMLDTVIESYTNCLLTITYND